MGVLSFRNVWRIISGVLLAVVFVGFLLWLVRPRFDVSEIQERVLTTIQSEAPESFYVTGSLDLTATSSVEDTRYLFPPPMRLNLGTTRATVRLPGRVAYGFDARLINPEHIAIAPNGNVDVTIPPLAVFSVEPRLLEMEVQTDVGWARTYAGSGQDATQAALALAQDILRSQAETYLEENTQPRVNTARALVTLLTPVLTSMGVAAPRFSFQIGPHLVMHPDG